MFSKVLVANRGEIARRIFRTCRVLGVSTVAVYSDADRTAPFVLEADEAVPLRGSTPGESYLRADKVIEAAELVGAEAIHPGYGFLSENADFARACEAAGIVFIGPTIEAIELMGSKITAREMMAEAGVPVLPGRDLTGVPDDEVVRLADEVGWPVLVKASFGGGGRGMRLVRDRALLGDAVASARREAAAAFGNDTVFLEHYVDNPRHVEIQIFGDTHGGIVHFNERECSIQRRHQKVVEESPSPVVGPELRARMGQAAVDAGKALGYVGAGTVEFLLAPDGSFYFLEVNTRLQVEHPVTELVTGLDLVRLQLEVASGGQLSSEAFDPTIKGHAIEVRLCAEDPLNDFLPTAGALRHFDIPLDEGLRLDSGVVAGDVVSVNYDSMLAKVIAYGDTREQATARLLRSLRRARIQGVTTNLALLIGILEHDDFAAGRIDTHFLERMAPGQLVHRPDDELVRAAAVAAALADQAANRAAAPVLATIPSGFRNNRSQRQSRSYRLGEDEFIVEYALGRGASYAVGHGEELTELAVEVVSATPTGVDLVVDGVRRRFTIAADADAGAVQVGWAQGSLEFAITPRFSDASVQLQEGSMLAPMPGTVVRVSVEEGDSVTAGQTVLVLEAMKMEHAITAAMDSVVTSIPVRQGDTVDTGTVLIVLDAEDSQASGDVEGVDA